MFNQNIESILNPTNQGRFSSLLLLVPELFTGKYKTVLNIGARESRFDFGNLFEAAGYTISIMEAHKPNADFLKSLNKYEVIEADITTYDFQNRKFDVVFWWHGPEHIDKELLPAVLKKIESCANEVVILGCPWGIYEQGIIEDNPFEVHKSHLLPEDFAGYKYLTMGNQDQHGSNIAAVKYIRPFMSIVTRHMSQRPNMFKQCCDSIDEQSNQDLEHIVIEDSLGVGVPLANALLAVNADKVHGQYVFILDDDNVFVDDNFITDIKSIIKNREIDLIFIKKYIGEIIFPRETSWNTNGIAIAEVDTGCVVVKKEVWLQNIHWFFNGGHCGDFSFIKQLMNVIPASKIYWQDKIYTKALRVGGGKPETEG